MSSDPDKIVLFASRPGEREPETDEEYAQALIDYFRGTAKHSPSPWWPLGLAVATMWQGLLTPPASPRELLRFLFVLNCSRRLGSIWFFMSFRLNRWAHDEMLATGIVQSSTAVWDAVEHVLSESEGYCLDCHQFYDVTASTGREASAPCCPSCGRPDSINLTVRTPHVCPTCFQGRPPEMRNCNLCQSYIEAVLARNRVEQWT